MGFMVAKSDISRRRSVTEMMSWTLRSCFRSSAGEISFVGWSGGTEELVETGFDVTLNGG
jgi:hypothetical protein